MNLLYCKEQLDACVDYVNENNSALKYSPISAVDVVEEAINGIESYEETVFAGISFKYQEVAGDIFLILWVLPIYLEENQNLTILEQDITDVVSKILLDTPQQEVEYNEDLDPRLTSLVVPVDSKEWH